MGRLFQGFLLGPGFLPCLRDVGKSRALRPGGNGLWTTLRRRAFLGHFRWAPSVGWPLGSCGAGTTGALLSRPIHGAGWSPVELADPFVELPAS